MMFLLTLLTTALALSSFETFTIIEELDVAFSPHVNDNLSLLLGLDAFQKLDVDGDGFLTKQEIKPYVQHYMELATRPLSEYGGKVVSREEFEKNLLVPNLGAIGNLNTDYCYMDHAFAETSASVLWTAAFGEVEYVSTEKFVEQSFETWQTEIKAPVQNLMNNLKERKALASFDYSKVPFVKLDDYSTVNPLCEGRRELMFQVAFAELAQYVGAWALAGMAESGVYCAYTDWFWQQACSFGDWARISLEGAALTGMAHTAGMVLGPLASGIFAGGAAVAPVAEEVAAEVVGTETIELGHIVIEDASCLWVFCD